jgi:hypothetical protein
MLTTHVEGRKQHTGIPPLQKLRCVRLCVAEDKVCQAYVHGRSLRSEISIRASCTALQKAAGNGGGESAGAARRDKEAKNDDDVVTPLHYAAEHRQVEASVRHGHHQLNAGRIWGAVPFHFPLYFRPLKFTRRRLRAHALELKLHHRNPVDHIVSSRVALLPRRATRAYTTWQTGGAAPEGPWSARRDGVDGDVGVDKHNEHVLRIRRRGGNLQLFRVELVVVSARAHPCACQPPTHHFYVPHERRARALLGSSLSEGRAANFRTP